jgi:hypothetical protein
MRAVFSALQKNRLAARLSLLALNILTRALNSEQSRQLHKQRVSRGRSFAQR